MDIFMGIFMDVFMNVFMDVFIAKVFEPIDITITGSLST